MTTSRNSKNKGTVRKYLWLAAIVIAVAGGLLAASVNRSVEKNTLPTDQPVFEVAKGPLTISVTESGTIKAKEQVILKSEVEGRSTILSLIPEGTHVKKGDLLVELDASQLMDTRVDQMIKVQNAEAAFIRARENLEVVKNQAASDVEKASLTLVFATEDLRKYKAGEFPMKMKEADSKIRLLLKRFSRPLKSCVGQKCFSMKSIYRKQNYKKMNSRHTRPNSILNWPRPTAGS
jgi:HlyD family secretion protein